MSISEAVAGRRTAASRSCRSLPAACCWILLLSMGRMPSPSYGVTVEGLPQGGWRARRSIFREGDVVLIRTGRMRYWPDGSKVFGDKSGITLDTAKWRTGQNIVVVGADNEAVEHTPSRHDDNWLPVHNHLLTEAGVPQIECLNLEEIAKEKLYEFAFIAAPIRLRGATGSPLRPLVFPLRS